MVPHGLSESGNSQHGDMSGRQAGGKSSNSC